MGEDKGKLAELEAILYASGRPVSLTSLVAYLRLASEMEAVNLISELSEAYDRDESDVTNMIVAIPREGYSVSRVFKDVELKSNEVFYMTKSNEKTLRVTSVGDFFLFEWG